VTLPPVLVRLHTPLSAPSVARYLAAWVAGAALVAGAAVVVLDGTGPEVVSVPPIEQTELQAAAQAAGCELRRQVRGVRLNPPVAGTADVAPAGAGVYEDAPDVRSLLAAQRDGIVVIQFRAGLDDARLDELRTIQAAAPNGTIVTPNATGMRFELGVTAYRRLLGCARATDAAIEALQLFRGRYLGSGPR
jgi:Protein of unknown function (DUF3105)